MPLPATSRHTARRAFIIVPVTNPEKTAFLVMPFAPRYDSLRQAINDAAQRAGLTPYRTDTSLGDEDFARDILHQTRRASIIVAVCSRDDVSGVPNPNVMYELGLAHSLGKATIILTDDISSLPSDLKTKQALEYNAKNIDENFVLKLTNRMIQTLTRVREGLVDSSCGDIATIDWYPTSWKGMLEVLDFGKQVHKSFQSLDTGHLDSLCRHGNDIVTGQKRLQSMSYKQTFQQSWDNYLHEYDSLEATFGGLLDPYRFEGIETAIAEMGKNYSGSELVKGKEFCERIRQRLQGYDGQHDEAVKAAGNDLLTLLEKPGFMDFLKKLINLRTEAKGIVMQADSLIVNMINVMKDGSL